MAITEYKSVSSTNPATLVNQVKTLMSDGWQPVPGQVEASFNSSSKMTQIMVKGAVSQYTDYKLIVASRNDVLDNLVNDSITEGWSILNVGIGSSSVRSLLCQPMVKGSSGAGGSDAEEVISQLSANDGSLLIGRIPSLADMRNTEPVRPGQYADLVSVVDGWNATKNGATGGGRFYYDSADTTSINDDAMVIVTAGGKRWKRIVDGGYIQASWFGVRTDGVDCYAAFMRAVNFITSNGGVLQLPWHADGGEINLGTGKTGNHRVTVQWFDGIKPFRITGHGRNSKVTFDNIDPGDRGSLNWTTEPSLFLFFGKNVTQYVEVEVDHIWVDYSRQRNKGGTDLATLEQTHATPYSVGCYAFNTSRTFKSSIHDVIITNVYGDGIKFGSATGAKVYNNYLWNVSGNNLLTRTGADNADSNGGGIYISAGFGNEIYNNIVWNPRVYTVSTVMPGTNVDVLGAPCGYIGIWTEGNLLTGGAGNSAPLTNAWLDPADTNVTARAAYKDIRANGVRIHNNIVFGYVIGIKGEGSSPLNASDNTVLECYLPIFPNGGYGLITGNHIDMLRLGDMGAPQIGFQNYRAYCMASVNVNETSAYAERPQDQGVTWRNNTFHMKGTQNAVNINCEDAVIEDNVFWVDGTVMNPFFRTPITREWRGPSFERNKIYISDSVTSITNNATFMQSGSRFFDNRVINQSAQEFLLNFNRFTYGRQYNVSENKFRGNVRVAITSSDAIVENNDFRRDAVYAGACVFVSSTGNRSMVRRNTFRIPSNQTAAAVQVQASDTTLERNVVQIASAGTATVPCFFDFSNGLTGTVCRGNQIVGNTVNNTPAFRFVGQQFPVIEDNKGDGTGPLMVVTTAMKGPARITNNAFSQLYTGTFVDPNLVENISTNWSAKIGDKAEYIIPVDGGFEGIRYTSNGWKNYGSISVN